MDRSHRWTLVGVGIVVVGGIGLTLLPAVGPILAAVGAGIVIGYGLADPTDGARAGLAAGFVGGIVPAAIHVAVFITVSAHDPDPPPFLSIVLQPSVLFGGLVFASVLGAVCIGSAALVGYLRERRVA